MVKGLVRVWFLILNKEIISIKELTKRKIVKEDEK